MSSTSPSVGHSSGGNMPSTNILLRVKRRRTDPPASCLVLVQPALRRSSDDNHKDDDVDDNDYHDRSLRFVAKRKTRDHHDDGGGQDLTAACLSSWQMRETGRSATPHENYQDDLPTPSSSSAITTTIWKRRNDDGGGGTIINGSGGETGDRMYANQIVDAVLEDIVGGVRTSKRRRLTLVEPSTTAISTAMTTVSSPPITSSTANPKILNSRNNARRRNNNKTKRSSSAPFYPVLDPLSRLVDDSLRAVHVGDVPIWQHWQLLTTDPRLLRPDGMPDPRRWFAWNQTTGGGNLLHACALWNDVELLTEILQASCNAVGDDDDEKPIAAVARQPSWLQIMLHAVNGDGWTPYQVAQLAGHEAIVQMLESVGGSSERGLSNMEEDYVYDEYWLYSENAVSDEYESTTTNSNVVDDPNHMMNKDMLTVELQGGYWENGELIFAPDEDRQDEEELGDHDDEDSNSEGYAANEYPDEQLHNRCGGDADEEEDDFDDAWYPEEKQELNGDDELYYDDSDREGDTTSFRRIPVHSNGTSIHQDNSSPRVSSYVYDDADDEYDASYGENHVVARMPQQERHFAYDREWDKEEDDEVE